MSQEDVASGVRDVPVNLPTANGDDPGKVHKPRRRGDALEGLVGREAGGRLITEWLAALVFAPLSPRKTATEGRAADETMRSGEDAHVRLAQRMIEIARDQGVSDGDTAMMQSSLNHRSDPFDSIADAINLIPVSTLPPDVAAAYAEYRATVNDPDRLAVLPAPEVSPSPEQR